MKIALCYAISFALLGTSYALFGKAGIIGFGVFALAFGLFMGWITGDWSNAHDDH